jgi:K+-transporting ATPase KdpF subunit
VAAMSLEYVIGLALSVLLLIYLACALLKPERF